jgi:hypothetical protein
MKLETAQIPRIGDNATGDVDGQRRVPPLKQLDLLCETLTAVLGRSKGLQEFARTMRCIEANPDVAQRIVYNKIELWSRP